MPIAQEVGSACQEVPARASQARVPGVDDPYILSLHDSGEAAGLPYYVIPYVKGESLRLSVSQPLSL